MRWKGLDPKNVFQALGVFFKRLYTTCALEKKTTQNDRFDPLRVWSVPGGRTPLSERADPKILSSC